MNDLGTPRPGLPEKRSQIQLESGMPSTDRMEAALLRMNDQAEVHRNQIRDLEVKLSEHLGNFRAVDSLLEDALTGLDEHRQRAIAATNKIPDVKAQLGKTREELEELSRILPVVRQQAVEIHNLYDSGRKKAQILVEDLTWLNTAFYERWRRIVFTSGAPVAFRWKLMMRFLFLLSSIAWLYILWISFSGIVRAYRHRLLWGEKLIS